MIYLFSSLLDCFHAEKSPASYPFYLFIQDWISVMRHDCFIDIIIFTLLQTQITMKTLPFSEKQTNRALSDSILGKWPLCSPYGQLIFKRGISSRMTSWNPFLNSAHKVASNYDSMFICIPPFSVSFASTTTQWSWFRCNSFNKSDNFGRYREV